jgi:hypothetical protein
MGFYLSVARASLALASLLAVTCVIWLAGLFFKPTFAAQEVHVETAPQTGPQTDVKPKGVQIDQLAAQSQSQGTYQKQRESRHSALVGQQNLERIAVGARPVPFDATAYWQDPLAYARIADASRIHLQADPRSDHLPLRPLTPVMLTTEPGATVLLQLQAAPGIPVTLFSYDRGAFGNNMATVTVITDATGIVSVPYTITPGTTTDCHNKASSPLARGHVDFIVEVLEKPSAVRKDPL